MTCTTQWLSLWLGPLLLSYLPCSHLPDKSWPAPCRWRWRRRGQWPGRSDSQSQGQCWSGQRKTGWLRPLRTPCSSYPSGHCKKIRSRKWAQKKKSVQICIINRTTKMINNEKSYAWYCLIMCHIKGWTCDPLILLHTRIRSPSFTPLNNARGCKDKSTCLRLFSWISSAVSTL